MADDDPTNRELLTDLLEAQGHEILEAVDGQQSLEVARNSLPDVLLLDVMMPAPNGFEVCRRLKSEERTAVIPILLVTALSDRKSRLEGISAGADDFLTKPIDTQETVLRVRNALRMKRLHDLAAQRFLRLKELEAAREEMTHMLVHDFKNPLSSLTGSLRMLEGETPLSEQGHLRRALRGGERLRRMITSMLDLNRIESQSLVLKPEKVRVDLFLGGLVDSLAALADAEVKLEVVVQDGLLGDFDPELIRRVLENLVDNAIRYLPLRGGQIAIRAHRQEERLRFEVEDNGQGIPPEQLGRIFDKYHTLEPNRSSQGLGLAFCKLAVELHGGTLGADSAPTEGTLFWFEI